MPWYSSLFFVLSEAGESRTIVFWSLVLIVLVFVGLYGVVRVRRWARRDDTRAEAGGGFTLSELRDLHRRGQISAEEYEKARSQIVAAGKSMTAGIDPLARANSKSQASDQKSGRQTKDDA